MKNDVKIRQVKLSDAEQLAGIYNFYVLNTHHTFETEPVSSNEMQKRIGGIVENYPYFVAAENEEILAFAYATKYKPRSAYKQTVEVSVYVKQGANGKGFATKLYEKLFEEIEQTDIHAVIAGIALPNEASIKLHEKFGFEKVAHFREVGFKFGKWIDVGYWELIRQK